MNTETNVGCTQLEPNFTEDNAANPDLFKPMAYTILVFLALCIASYIASV